MVWTVTMSPEEMYRFQGFYSDSISNKSRTYAAEAFSKYILNNSHNDQWTSPPTTSKAESQAYSQTIRLPSHHFTSPNHMACKLRIHSAGQSERRWHNRDVFCRVVSSVSLRSSVDYACCRSVWFTILHEPVWQLQWKIETEHISQ